MQYDTYILCNCPPPLAARKSLISRSAVASRKSSYAGVVSHGVIPFTHLFFAGTRSMRRKLPGGPLKLNASHARNRFEQRLADAGGVANCSKRQWRSDIMRPTSLSRFSIRAGRVCRVTCARLL